MAQMNMIEAIRSAHDVMMERDPSVVVLGEDVGYFGGVFRCTDGLQRKYGEHRVIDGVGGGSFANGCSSVDGDGWSFVDQVDRDVERTRGW